MVKEQIAPISVILRYLVEHPEYYKHINIDFFPAGEEFVGLREIYNILVEMYARYKSVGINKTPSAAEIISEIHTKNKSDIVTDDYVKELFDINLYDYSEEDLKDKLEQWIKYRTYRTDFESVAMEMKSAEREQMINVETVGSYIDRWTHKVNEVNTLMFDNGNMLDLFDAEMHKPVFVERTPSAFSYLNMCLGGGLAPKTLVVYMGGTNVGKCVCGDTRIKIRNKHTGECREVTMEELYEMHQPR